MSLPSIPSGEVSRDYLRIAGGYGASAMGQSPAGGLDIDNAGHLATDGDVTVDGVIDAKGGNLVNSTGNLTLDAQNSAAHSTVYVKNSDGSYEGSLDVERNVVVGGNVTVGGRLVLTPANETISSGAITVTGSFVTVNPESGVVDDLDTINGGADLSVLFLRPSGSATITLKHGSGNIVCPGGSDLVLQYKRVIMVYDTSLWHVLAVQ